MQFMEQKLPGQSKCLKALEFSGDVDQTEAKYLLNNSSPIS